MPLAAEVSACMMTSTLADEGKMKFLIAKTDFLEARWTDETPASRSGIGSIDINGIDYGPADMVPGDGAGRCVAQWLCDSRGWGDRYGRTGPYSKQEIQILRRFCSQWPEGPQFEQVTG